MTYVPDSCHSDGYKATARKVSDGEKTIISDGAERVPKFETSATVDENKLAVAVGATGGEHLGTTDDIIITAPELVTPNGALARRIVKVSGTRIEVLVRHEKESDVMGRSCLSKRVS